MPKAEPLTKAEVKWLNDLEKLLLACPSDRIGFLAIGDPSLTVVDNGLINQFYLEVHDGEAEKNGLS